MEGEREKGDKEGRKGEWKEGRILNFRRVNFKLFKELLDEIP